MESGSTTEPGAKLVGSQYPAWSNAVRQEINSRSGLWGGSRPSDQQLQHGFWIGLTPSEFASRGPQSYIDSVPFDSALVPSMDVMVAGDRPAITGLRMQELFGIGAIVVGLCFLGLCIAQGNFGDERIPVILGSVVVGVVILALSKREHVSKSLDSSQKLDTWHDRLGLTGLTFVAVDPIGREGQPIGLIAVTDSSANLFLVVGTSPVMYLGASKVQSVEVVTKLEDVYLGGMGNVEGVLVGGLGKVSHVRFCGVSMLIDDIANPRLTIELPYESDCKKWADRISVLRGRAVSQ